MERHYTNQLSANPLYTTKYDTVMALTCLRAGKADPSNIYDSLEKGGLDMSFKK